MARGSVDFRANANGLVIVFGDDDDFNSIYEQISQKLDSGGYFFHTRYFVATYKGRRLDPGEERMISKMMAEKTGAKTVIFEIDPSCEPPRARQARQAEPEPEQANSVAGGRMRLSADLLRKQRQNPDERLTKYVRSSLRPGQSARYDGEIVVLGDIKAGAKVVATGSVIVLGKMRGEAHAGASGDASATVISLAFASPHVRIAGIANPNRRWDPDASLWPEIAYLDGGKIVFMPLDERQLAPTTQ